MTQETTYVAKDGRRFYGAGAYDACVKYERELQRAEQGRVDLAKFVRFFDWNGKELTYEQARDNLFSIYYVAYLQPITEDILWTMLEEVSWEIADALRYGETGWYFSNGTDNWKPWSDYAKEFCDAKAALDVARATIEEK